MVMRVLVLSARRHQVLVVLLCVLVRAPLRQVPHAALSLPSPCPLSFLSWPLPCLNPILCDCTNVYAFAYASAVRLCLCLYRCVMPVQLLPMLCSKMRVPIVECCKAMPELNGAKTTRCKNKAKKLDVWPESNSHHQNGVARAVVEGIAASDVNAMIVLVLYQDANREESTERAG